jgi:3-oxoacyl-[acyl-carrier-protein] synthase II
MATTVAPNPVSITGIGAVTAYGWGADMLRTGLYSGKSAIKAYPGYLPDKDPRVPMLGLVEDGGAEHDGPSRLTRAFRHVVREAVLDARSRGWHQGDVVGIIHCVTLGEVDLWKEYWGRQGRHTTKRQWMEMMPSTMSMMAMKEFGFHGPSANLIAMCAGGLVGVITAQAWISAGMATDVVVVASDLSGTPEVVRSFYEIDPMQLEGDPFDVCRPFQEGSKGFHFGEGSAGVVVSASPTGAYATVLGGAVTHEAYHPIAMPLPSPEIHRCVTEALDRSGVTGADIDYINGYGNGNQQADAVEAEAIDSLLPGAKGLFSVKPLVSHCMSASAMVELPATLWAYETGIIPAPPLSSTGHRLLLDGATPADRDATWVKFSFGFGGVNAVLVMGPPHHNA